MNIFYLHSNPKICAIYHNNKHLVKMILETTLLLYTCLHITTPELLENAPLNKSGNKGYKPSHQKHPSAIWTRSSIFNYKWLCSLGIELCHEYTFRYYKIHSCQEHLIWLIKQTPNIPKNIPFTQPLQAMPDKYKNNDSIIAYRNYYIHEKAYFSKWTKRNPPYWFSSSLPNSL